MDVTILNRTPEKARILAERMGCSYGPPGAFRDADPGVIVNATPVGMHPDQGTPVDPSLLRSDMTVFDLVYTPPDTPLIRYARQAGCETITGIELFVRQACAQFRYFTGMEVPVRLVRECVMEE